MQKLEKKPDHIDDILAKILPLGACERALICKQATTQCKHMPYLTPEENANLRVHLEKRWMDCYAYKQDLGMFFDKDLGVYILPRCPCCGTHLKIDMMGRAGK